MKALGGSFRQRAERSLAAGCDLVLHCNGEMDEMTAVAEGVDDLTDQAMVRVERGRSIRRDYRDTDDFDVEATRARFHELLDMT